MVAGYWEDLWRRLHDPELWSEPVVEMVPGDGAMAHPVSADSVEARLHLSFSRGVDSLGFGSLRVFDEDGEQVPVSVHHHYGNYSHAVLVEPLQDWQQDSDYRLVLDGPLLNYDGITWTGDWSSDFSTRPLASDKGCDCSFVATRSSSASALFVLALIAFVAQRRGLRWGGA